MTTTTDDGGMYGQLPTCFGSTPSPQTQAENCCDSCPVGDACAIDPGPACDIPVEADLTRHKLVYLGSPYTKYRTGLDAAFRDVAAIAAQMLHEGVRVYSPIAHTHPIAIHGNLDPRNHDIWLPFDQAMMDAADAMCIADMDGWRESYGVQYEIDYFRRQGKPVYFRAASGEASLYNG